MSRVDCVGMEMIHHGFQEGGIMSATMILLMSKATIPVGKTVRA